MKNHIRSFWWSCCQVGQYFIYIQTWSCSHRHWAVTCIKRSLCYCLV